MSIETGLVIVLLIWLVVNTLALNDLFKRMEGGCKMTTRIIIVNEGPDNVEVQATGKPMSTLKKGQHQGEYVFEGQDVNIKEVKETKE
jgi:hypothetical protein